MERELIEQLMRSGLFSPSNEMQKAKAIEKQRDAEFKLDSQQAIEEGTSQLRTLMVEEKAPAEVFYDLLDFYGKKRNEIACRQQVGHSELFGLRRDLMEDLPALPPLTVLNKQYQSVGNRLLTNLQSHLAIIPHDLRRFHKRTLKTKPKKTLNRVSYSDFQIYNDENTALYTITPTIENCKRLKKFYSEEPFDESIHPVTFFNNILLNKDLLQIIKEKSPSDYKVIKNSLIMLQIREEKLEGRKTDWVSVTPRLEINGKMYALSQYWTYMNRSFHDDPVENMTGLATVTLYHQDTFLMKDTLLEVANIFKDIIEWDGKDISALKNNMALFEYLFSHVMPFARGSAAVSEWFEKSLYAYHGFELAYAKGDSINLNALTTPFDEFIGNYASMIKLTKQVEHSQLQAEEPSLPAPAAVNRT